MTAEVSEMNACEASLEIAREEVERVLGDARFRVTVRQRNILRYLAQCRFSGCTRGVKAYSIALDVLGRSSAFNAETDPIVRIEISRLRNALDSYYQAFGESRGVSIHIPKGSYVTLFPKVRIPHEPGEEHEEVGGGGVVVHSAVAGPVAPSFGLWMRTGATLLAAAAIPLVGLAAAGIYDVVSNASYPVAQPTVYLSLKTDQEALRDEVTQTHELLLAAISQFETISIAKAGLGESKSPLGGRTYEVDMKYYGDGDNRSIWWQLVDPASGNLLGSGLEKIDTSGRSAAAVRQDMAGSLARTFASSRGVINSIEMLAAPPGALGNPCILRAESALDQGGSTATDGTTRCLEGTLALDPNDPHAAALLSRILLRDQAGEPGEIRTRALELAKHAVSIAPMSDQAQTALMAAQFANGRPSAAIEAGNRAMAANPNNADSAGELAMVLYASGYIDAGVAMAEDAVHDARMVPRAAALVLALDAYSRGRYSEASLIAEQIACPDFLVRTLRVASLGELGGLDARSQLLELRGGASGFDEASRRKLAATGLPAPLVARLESGLAKAGGVAVASAAGP
ncbi:MAG: hypothetical protein E6Q76_18215 [Rhizobium sp.]|nr:MAG: hypothetical protein E6Q76_18215 [Rhizobium sp.]